MRLRSHSLFQSNHKSTADRLEGTIDSDDDLNEITGPVFRDDETIYYETDEDDQGFPNVQLPTNQKNLRERILSDLHFVKTVKSRIDATQSESFKKSLKKIKANKMKGLTFMTGDDFIEKFMEMQKKMGKFRTLYSVIHDLEIYLKKSCNKHPDKPFRPLPPHLMFFEEMKANGKHCPVNSTLKWVAKKYSQLSVRDKSIYIKKHDLLMKNYYRKMEEFYKKYPNERRVRVPITPFSLFFNELKSEDENLNRQNALEQWKNLSIKDKATYIKKAYQHKNNLVDNRQKDITSSNGKGLFSKDYRKPKKPPMYAYMLYKQAARTGSDLPGPYKSLPNEEKEMLTENLNEMWKQYERSMLQYINGLSGKEKDKEQKELMKILAKYTLQKCGLKRNASEPPVNNGAAEDVAPRKKQKSANVRVGEGGDTSGDCVNNTKAKKFTLTENRSTQEMPTLSTKPAKKIKKATPLPKQPSRSTQEMLTLPTKPSKKVTKAVQKATPLLIQPSRSTQEMSTLSTKPAKKIKKAVSLSKQPKQESVKKNIVTKKSKKIEFTEDKPPKSLFRYFKSINSFDSPSKAKAHYRKLSNSEKMNINKTYKTLCKSFLNRFREHLHSFENTDEIEDFVGEFNKKTVEESEDSLDEDEPMCSDSDPSYK